MTTLPKRIRKIFSGRTTERATLEACTLNNTPKFSLVSQELKKGKVLEVIDGDTCDIALPYAGQYYVFRCRLDGIDTPEKRPRRSDANRNETIISALASMRYLESLVLDKIVRVKITGYDKYGRVLVDIYPPESETTVSELILQNQHGVPYYSRKKAAVPLEDVLEPKPISDSW